MGHKFVAVYQWCLIWCLQTIVSCFAGPMWWKHNVYSLFLKLMRQHLDKKLTYQSLRCFSVAIYLEESSIKSGRWMLLIKRVVYYGGFAESVFRRVSDYNHDVFNVSWSVRGVIRMLRMIDMLLWVVRCSIRIGIGQGFRLCCNRELELWDVWQILFLIYVVQKAKTLLVRWLYFFGKFGLQVMMSFGMILITLQRALGGQH